MGLADVGHSSNITYGTAGGGSGSSKEISAQIWIERIKKAQQYKLRWSQRMRCDKLEMYYMGQQWEPSGTNYEPYTINLIFSTIEIKLPTLLFTEPLYHVKPRPSGSEYDFEDAVKRALLREDILNTQVTSAIPNFSEHIQAAILDAFFRFGIIEVGYSADWVDNPNADQPILRSDNEPYVGEDGNVIKQPKRLPKDERIYIKRIHARNFLIGGIFGGLTLEDASWCAYWEYVRTEDLKANKNLTTEGLTWAGGRSNDFVDVEYGPEVEVLVRSGDLCKIWHVFDMRKKERLLIADPQVLLLKKETWERLPLFDLRFHKLNEGWYPLPPVTNWKSPQDEYNEAREQQRNHRKRFIRKFIYNGSSIPDEEEIAKLINGGDGTFVRGAGDIRTAVAPIENADLGTSSQIGLTVTKDDFNIVSGTSEEQRGQADKTTATQANIINQKAAIRDSRARIQVAEWLSRIGKEVLLTAEEKLTYGMWVRMTVADKDQVAQEQTQEVWHKVTGEDLKDKEGYEDLNFDVDISLDSMSPVENDQTRQAFLLFISTIQQFPELALNPTLVREAAYKCGYRNEKVIKQMMQAAQLMLVQKMEQLQLAAKGASQQMLQSQMGQSMTQQATPPVQGQINNQLNNPATNMGVQ